MPEQPPPNNETESEFEAGWGDTGVKQSRSEKIRTTKQAKAALRRSTLTPTRAKKVLDVLYKLAKGREDEDGNFIREPDKEAARTFLAYCLGKPTQEFVMSHEGTIKHDQRILIAEVAAGLKRYQPIEQASEETVDGVLEYDGGPLPALPAPVHQLPEEVRAGGEGGANRVDILPQLEGGDQADHAAPGPTENTRDLRVEEPGGRQ